MAHGGSDRVEITPCEAEDDLVRFAALWRETQPETARSIAELRHEEPLTPSGRRFMARLAGQPVGAAVSSTFYARPPDFEGAWTTVMVRAPFRERGIGTALLDAVADHARTLGKTAMFMDANEERPESVRFLQRRGFTERERAKFVALRLAGRTWSCPSHDQTRRCTP